VVGRPNGNGSPCIWQLFLWATVGGSACAGQSALAQMESRQRTANGARVSPHPIIAGGRITGYTPHGLDQAICREGVGVHPRAILDAVRNPQKVVIQPNGRIRYEGEGAVVVTEPDGTVVTTWSKGSKWHRIPR